MVKMLGHVVSAKYLRSVPTWLPSLFSYGAAGIFGMCYFGDVTAVMKYIPFYNQNLRYPYEDDKRVYVLPNKDL